MESLHVDGLEILGFAALHLQDDFLDRTKTHEDNVPDKVNSDTMGKDADDVRRERDLAALPKIGGFMIGTGRSVSGKTPSRGPT